MDHASERLADLLSGEKQKIFTIAIIIAALIIAFLIYKKQTETLDLLNLQKDTQVRKNELLMQIGQSEKKLKSYKEILKERDPGAITDAIRKIAENSNLRVVSIDTSGEEKWPLYNKYTFTVVLDADSYHNIGNFISNIENYSEVYSVDSIEIKKAGAAVNSRYVPTGELVVNTTISVIAFTG